MKKCKLNEFIEYLNTQVGQPYVWGAQHLMLTSENYVLIITKREKETENRANAIAFCKKKFDDGATVLYAYDCSGLGMYLLQNVLKIFDHDLSANGMMGNCKDAIEPKRGYWVFRLDSKGKATHIGYMVSDTEVIHAKGRAYGVVKETYRQSYWQKIGIPDCIDFGSPTPQPYPKTHEYVYVKGNVRVREGNGTSYPQILPTAHKGDMLPCYGQADKDPYWYEVEWQGKLGYISCNERYTKLIYK